MKQLRQQQGFTMIELIMVIVILGVLSAFALPRFADLGSGARTAAIEGLAGSLKSSIGISRAQWFASGETNCATPPVATTDRICLDGSLINIAYGYPTADEVEGIIRAAGLTEGTFTANVFTDGDYTYTKVDGVVDSSSGTLTISTGPTPTTCRVVYTDAQAASGTVPTVVATTTGC